MGVPVVGEALTGLEMAKGITAPWVIKSWTTLARKQETSFCHECGERNSVGYICVEHAEIMAGPGSPWHKDVYLCQACADADSYVAVLRLAKLVRVED